MTDKMLIDLPDQLVGERVLVRPYRPGDGEAMFEAIEESRDHILPWMPWGPGHAAQEDSEKIVRGMSARWQSRDDMPVGVFERDSGRYLGGSGLHRIDWDVRIFEIGYWVRKSDAGKGYVTEAVRLLIDLAFETLEANRVFIRCAIENEKSAAVARRAGFQLEGCFRRSIKDAYGGIHDALVFSMIPEEWQAIAQAAESPKTAL